MVHAKHLKFSGPIFRNVLCKLFNKMFTHSFISVDMLKGHMRPILKYNTMSKTSFDSYRPIMNSSIFLRLIEYKFLPYLTIFFKIDNRQFSYRTETCC